MSVKILESSSFGILRTNPKITGNVKVVVDSSNNIFIESISANSELAQSKYKAIKTSSSSSYQFDLARIFGNTPSEIFYDVKKPSSDFAVLDNYGGQYDFDYCYGSYSINSDSFKEEFGLFAPLWVEDNLPDYFVIFRLDGPVTVNNKNANSENENAPFIEDVVNFKDLYLKGAKVIKTIDLTNNTDIGRYIRNYKSSNGFPISSLNFTTRSDQGTYWNGVSIDKPGGFTSKAENIYNTFFTVDRTILENDFFITNGFERNRLTCANILNLEFLFDDTEANSFEINRYFGLYVNVEKEGTFRIDGTKAYLRSLSDLQTKPVNENTFVPENEKSFTVSNKNGVKLYIDTNFTTTTYDIPQNSLLTANDFTPKFNDITLLNSIFYVKDRNNNLHNLNYTNNWLADEVRLQDTSIDIKDFTGFEETILTTRGLVPDKPSKSSTVIEINGPIPYGDRYVIALPKKQTYIIDVINAVAGDTVTISDVTNTASISFILSSSNSAIALSDIEYNWDISTDDIFQKYVTSVRNGKLILSESVFTCIDDNFTISVSGTSVINISKQVSSDLSLNTISANSTIASIPGQASGLFFNNTGTNNEVAASMAAAINNIQDSLFEATSIDNKVIVVAKVAGPRFNGLIVGKDIFLQSNNSVLITSSPAFTHPEFLFYYFQGGTINKESKAIVDIDLFTQFTVPYRFLRTNADKKTNETLVRIQSVFYYTDEPIRDINGKLIGFKNFDKYCVVAVNEKYDIFRDSFGSVYLYELFDIQFGRLSFFPIKTLDFNYLSTEYGDEKELNVETEYYSSFPTTYSTHEDIENFYTAKGFTTLLNVLESETTAFLKSKNIENPNIECEYERLKENTLTTTSVPSRTVPYINKWVYRNGKNVRETDYRLTSSEAFGLTNFSPGSDENSRDPNYFTQEWYYLQLLPKYFGLFAPDRLNDVFSYFPNEIDVTNNGLLNVSDDYFTDYFTVDYLLYPELSQSTYGIQPFSVASEIPYEIKKQFRYSLFEGASTQNFATTLFRGVKVIIKERVENAEKVDYNLVNIKTKFSNRFNGYKFSCVLIPNDGTYGGVKRKTIEYEFVENRKYKAVTLLIYLKIDDIMCSSYYDPNPNIVTPDYIDRTILYALKSKLISIDPAAIPANNYDNILLSGSINATLGNSFVTPNTGNSFLLGVPNSTGQETLFTEEILINKDGRYNNLLIQPLSAPVKTYTVSKVQDNNKVNVIDLAPGGWLPAPYLYASLSSNSIENGTYIYENGGYTFWNNRLNRVNFSFIQNLINQGDPSIKYTTVLENGNIQNNLFLIELQTANFVLKSNYLRPETVIDRSNASNDLTTLVGNQLIFGNDSKISPIYRHSGYYQPKSIDIIDFKDPYITELDLDGSNDQELRTILIKEKMEDKNTEFMLTPSFGKIFNLYFHKVNDINPGGILQLSTQSSTLPVYPITNQIAIDQRVFYTFKSNWDANYFVKSLTKGVTVELAGTRSINEKRSFFGSKVMKIEDSLTVETFNSIQATTEAELETLRPELLKTENPFEVAYFEDVNKIIIDVYLEKRLTQKISESGVYEFFDKYINRIYGFGSEDDILDDVYGYIQLNILPRYSVNEIFLYVLKSGNVNLNSTYPVINSTITDAEKQVNGYVLDKNVQVLPIGDLSNYNVRLIYNKTPGFKYSIAPSFRINKK